MTDPQWANYYNTALAAGQSSQQAKAYADKQVESLKKAADNNTATATKKAMNRNVTTTDPRWANYYNTAISAGQSQQQAKAYADSQVETLKKAADNNTATATKKATNRNVTATDPQKATNRNVTATDPQKATNRNVTATDPQKEAEHKEIKETGQKAGEWFNKTYNKVKPYVQKGASALWNNSLTQSYLKSLNPFQQTVPENKYLEESAREADNAAARMDANAQRNAQVANRDYKQASADEAITAGSAAAMSTMAQMSGAAGSAAAALAGQNAGNQATNSQYQTAVARNQGRSDQQNELAYDKRNQASVARSNAISARKEAQANITDKEATDKRNTLAQQLIEGNAELTRQERELDIAERQQRLEYLQDLAKQQTATEEQQKANSQLNQQNNTQMNEFINSLSDEALKAYGLQRITGAQ